MLDRLPRPVAAGLLAAVFVLTGCGPASETDRAESGPLDRPFYLSDFFTPSGHMGDGQLPGHIKQHVGEEALAVRRQWCQAAIAAGIVPADQCPDRPTNPPTAEHPEGVPAGGDAYTFVYSPSELLWAGVYWVHPANNWGSRPGRQVTYKYSRVRFWAATDTEGIGAQFIIGGIQDPLLKYKDQFRRSIFENLSLTWQQFEITIPEQAMFDQVIGGFCWVTAYDAGTDYLTAPPRTIFIDDVVWE